jgi:DNA-binding NarL/FixJ family response regulator
MRSMEKDHILALGSDLFFAPKIESAAAALGCSTKWVREYATVQDFMQALADAPPALIVLDLNSALPWAEWLPAAKTEFATRRIPWLAFGSHMNPRRLKAARYSGADKVVPKSEFSAALVALMQDLLEK